MVGTLVHDRSVDRGVEESGTRLRKASPWEIYWPVRVREPSDAVYLASFPKIIYFWPSLMLFFLCGVAQAITTIDPATIGWCAISVLAFNLLVVVRDFDQKKFVIFGLTFVIGALAVWITNLKGIPVFKEIGGWLGSLEPTLSTSALFILAGLLALLMVWGLVTTRFNYWRLEPNEFVHYVQPVGRDKSFPREQHTVTKEVPDVFEYLLSFGGGTLVIYFQNQEVARIPDVPCLARRMTAIEEMLGVKRVRMVQ